MAPAAAVVLFCVSLAVTLAAARTFAGRLDELGCHLGMPEALVGLLTALAADGPEISSALTALAKGARGASLGVVAGSNVFNLAAMVGLSALVAGCVRVRRESLALEGAVASLTTLIVVALVLGAIPAGVAAALLAVVLLPYLALVVAGPRVAPRRLAGVAARALGGQAATRRESTRGLRPALLIPLDVALIVGGSIGMVQTALSLAGRWGLSGALVGVLALGPLTSLPNALTGVRLGLAGRGAALVSESLNSNNINLVVGVALPALFVAVAGVSTSVAFDCAWIVVMTAVALLVLARPAGAGRLGGAALVALYVVFVVVQVVAG
jgi:cation:H+ antiporter